MESPPPLTENSEEKGIKDFNRQYLNQGMWPSKLNRGDSSYLNSTRAKSSKLNSSMRVGDKLEKLESCRVLPKSKNIVPPLRNL